MSSLISVMNIDDRLALASWKTSYGHISATGHPFHFWFVLGLGSRGQRIQGSRDWWCHVTRKKRCMTFESPYIHNHARWMHGHNGPPIENPHGKSNDHITDDVTQWHMAHLANFKWLCCTKRLTNSLLFSYWPKEIYQLFLFIKLAPASI